MPNMSSPFSVNPKDSCYNITVVLPDENSIGTRIARFRKERGYTQKELAEKMNIAWTLISDYERGKLRLHDKVLRKFAMALEVSTDEILGLAREKHPNIKPSLKIMRRLTKIDTLPQPEQKALLRIIDGFLKGVGKGK